MWLSVKSLNICIDGTGQARQTGVLFLPHICWCIPPRFMHLIGNDDLTGLGRHSSIKVHVTLSPRCQELLLYNSKKKKKIKNRTGDFSVEGWDSETGRNTVEIASKERKHTQHIGMDTHTNTYTYGNKLCYA